MRVVVRIVFAAVMLLGFAAGPVAAGVPVNQADLSVSKSGTPDPVLPGTNITYTIIVQNAGPDEALNVVWTDAVPTGTTFVSLIDLTGNWTLGTPPVGGTGAVTGQIASLSVAAGAQIFVLVVQVEAGVANGTPIDNIVNVTASSNDPNPINNSFIAIVTAGLPATPIPSVPDAAMPEPAGTDPVIPLGIAAVLVAGLVAVAGSVAVAVVSRRRSSA